MSYTDFSYHGCFLGEKEVVLDESVTVHVTVSNVGKRKGTQIVQLYIKDCYASMVRPERELAGFARVTLMPQEEKEVVFALHPSQTAFLDEDMRWRVEKGEIKVLLGTSSGEIFWQDHFVVTETGFVAGRERKFYDYHKL